MTDTQTSHITVNHEDHGAKYSCIYAIGEDTRREMEAWSSKRNPTSRDLLVWLVNKGCRLDSTTGPAVVLRDSDCSTVEQYYRDGKLHRDDGPAMICHNLSGTTVERYYRDGAFAKVEYRRAPPFPSPDLKAQRPAPKASGPA